MIKRIFLKHKFKIISTIAFILIFLLFTNPADNRKNNNDGIVNHVESKVDNLLDEEHRLLNDSIKQIKNFRVGRIKGQGNSWSAIFIGVKEITECDTCNHFKFRDEPGNTKKYFIELPGYTLHRDASFFIEKDKYFIERTIWDRVSADFSTGHPVIKEIPVRYSFQEDKGSVLIPVSEKTYRSTRIVVWIMQVVFIIFLFITLMILPYYTLARIASGKPFEKSNIRNLNITGWTLVIISLLTILIPLLIEYFLRHKIPNEIYFPFWLSLVDNRTMLIAGIIVLLIANAFKTGYKLKQDHELTV